MSFNLQSFVGEPRMEEFNSLKKAELLQVAQHFKLTVNTSMGKGEIKKIALYHLIEEELLPEEELENVNTREDHLELKKLEFQEREWAPAPAPICWSVRLDTHVRASICL